MSARNMGPAGGFHPVSHLCHALLRLAGWRIVWQPAAAPKAVIMVYPHTSNWDFILGILFRFAVRMPIRWAAKDTLFREPAGMFFRALGGVAVNRRERTGFVEQMAKTCAGSENFYLAITPEGTRSGVPHMKSGFYRLARLANIPVGLGCIDYARREVGILGYLTLTGDETADLATLAEAYAGRRGKYPAQQGPFMFPDATPDSRS